MTLEKLKDELREYVHIEDDAMIDVMIATIIANRLKIGNPVWMILIGASSGGKSQILRPLALTDPRFLHRIDDITENTFLSGSVAKGGKDVSLLNRIGTHGMITISDLTILFSRNAESRNAILSQFRMIYDGEMVKFVGNKDKPVSWKGYLGIVAGGTPSIYAGFEDVADMGERFLCYRMKPYNEKTATQLALKRTMSDKEIDEKISVLFAEYIKDVVNSAKEIPTIPVHQMDKIIDIALFAERVRTVNKIDKYTKDIERIPTPAMPMRTALQLSYIARAIMLMRGRELDDKDMTILSWLGFSLANEEKRAVLGVLATYIGTVQTQEIADTIGLDTKIIRSVLQNLASTGIVIRGRNGGASLDWTINPEYRDTVKHLFSIKTADKIGGTNSLTQEEEIETDDIF